MTTEQPRYKWVVSKPPFSMKLHPHDIKNYVDKREIVKQTPKGYRLKLGDGTWDSFFHEDHYHFFDSEAEALQYLKGQADAMIDALLVAADAYQDFHTEVSNALMECA